MAEISSKTSIIWWIRYYYGNDMYISTADIISGVPSSWPGYDLTVGSSGDKVRQLQTQLNRIARNYPAIPTVNADGIYESATANAVRIFQGIFNLSQTVITDYPTWYEVSQGCFTKNNWLAQIPIWNKECEITAIPELLKLLDIQGSTVTTDAVGTQTQIMEQILSQEGHFVLMVKKNQPQSYDEIVKYFGEMSEDHKKMQEDSSYRPRHVKTGHRQRNQKIIWR